ncbi:MAG TPA: universal stress protein [Acetobacteraceae bacterium]|nr:universal stress protein [Acetobacteraceae bacterium]
MKRIVAAVDRSEPSLRAADLAADLASKYDAELVLLTVGHEIAGPDPGMEAYARLEHVREPTPTLVIESIRGELAEVHERAAAKGARHISIEVLVGEPAAQILASANAGQADLIVMGSRGHGRLAGLLLGSVAQKVVALARCPVLVVH